MGRKKTAEVKQIATLLEKVLTGDRQDEKLLEIKSASINDDFCNYSYEIVSGIGLGDTHNVKGSGIIDDDMRRVFSVFNVHLAVIDDVFKHSDTDIDDIDTMHGHELATIFHVDGFIIKGGDENESIILIGNKYCHSAGGRIELKSPKIALDNLSSYKWYNELKKAADDARREVELYKNGKYTTPEKEEPEDGPKQTRISFDHPAGEQDTMDDFEAAKA